VCFVSKIKEKRGKSSANQLKAGKMPAMACGSDR